MTGHELRVKEIRPSIKYTRKNKKKLGGKLILG